VLFTLFAGEAIRDTGSWWGFAIWDGAVFVLLAAVAMGLWRSKGGLVARRPLRGLLNLWDSAAAAGKWSRLLDRRVLLGAFIGWAVLSVVWSAYRPVTLLAIGVLLATTFAAVVLYGWIGWTSVTRAFAVALQAILVLSLLFEFVVAAVIRHPILPVFPFDPRRGDDVPAAYYWSRALLFEGGRIQGILGNANLLGFVALLALIVTGCLLVAGRIRRSLGIAGVVLAVLMLALTRSSTVILAGAACVVVLALMLLWRRTAGTPPQRRTGFWALLAFLVLAVVAGVAANRALLPLLGKSEDLTGRLDIWSAVGGLVSQRPVLGWGWISYWVPGTKPYEGLAVRNGVQYLQAHNAFLDVTVQLGVIGLLLFVAFLVAICVGVARSGAHGGPGAATPPGDWVFDRVLPALLLAALLTQALAESRLLVEGNWALLCLLALSAGLRSAPPTPAREWPAKAQAG
jgi:exopolysaccharide production protein ExoQ